MYTNIESCCIPEINIMSYANYTSIFFKTLNDIIHVKILWKLQNSAQLIAILAHSNMEGHSQIFILGKVIGK